LKLLTVAAPLFNISRN